MKTLSTDFKSGLIVSLVALPLCLGISVASGAPVLSGLIAGIVGGIVVGLFSNSPLSVTGPAAGLTIIIIQGIQEIGSFQLFLPAIVLAGVIQIIAGFLKAGEFTEYLPLSVIEGMLASIGLILIIKQLPLLLGHTNYEDLLGLVQNPGEHIQHFGAILIGIISITLYTIARSSKRILHHQFFKFIPFPLFIITLAAIIATIFNHTSLELPSSDYVHISEFIKSYHLDGFFSGLTIEHFFSAGVLKYAVIIAAVASIESLLCIEAADQLDTKKRKTNKNRELKAQGIGNIISGILGGLPVTSVIVRTSANAQAGAVTKKSTIIHGILLLVFITLLPNLIEKAPLAALASILILTGYNLANPKLFKKMYHHGPEQFVPFIITIIGVLSLDLLKGVAAGVVCSIFLALKDHYKLQNKLLNLTVDDSGKHTISFGHHLNFINRKSIKLVFESIPSDSMCVLNFDQTHHIDSETIDLIKKFIEELRKKGIVIEIAPNKFI